LGKAAVPVPTPRERDTQRAQSRCDRCFPYLPGQDRGRRFYVDDLKNPPFRVPASCGSERGTVPFLECGALGSWLWWSLPEPRALSTNARETPAQHSAFGRKRLPGRLWPRTLAAAQPSVPSLDSFPSACVPVPVAKWSGPVPVVPTCCRMCHGWGFALIVVFVLPFCCNCSLFFYVVCPEWVCFWLCLLFLVLGFCWSSCSLCCGPVRSFWFFCMVCVGFYSLFLMP